MLVVHASVSPRLPRPYTPTLPLLQVWTLYGSLLTLAPHSPAVPYSGNGAEHLADFACLAGWNRLSR